ncbi:MAG: ParB/RepB/Spo0J family partition protein [Lachnospiraceae bacterium]|nr:ParB/RepB/Spo0J family partition protein [Lachnospiraceae bacterium]MBR4413442.1 ParB/RepB/Spo0J family partition protein [Lachnospiraceae bacterium]MBR5066950.1 ParB/RepB/Spo0J family partition protein [Lachnospiraceae bacterium]
MAGLNKDKGKTANKGTGLNKKRGLDLLIKSNVEDAEVSEKYKNSIVMMNISKVVPNRSQPRKNFNEDALNELADSIKEHGIIEPLIVQDRKDHYEIIAGERRWRAANIAGLTEVPIIIKDLTELEIVELALIENIQREDLNPIEEAQAYKRLIDEFNLKQDEVADKVSKSRTAITNTMRLLKLCPEVQQMLIDEMISAGHARALLGIENAQVQSELAQQAFDQKMSVREIEKLVRNIGKEKKAKLKKDEQISIAYKEYENKLKEKLGTKVNINLKENGSGKIEIEFYSNDDFERIIDCIK